MFGKQKPSPQQVTNGRFEIERDGHVAYLEYNLAGKVLQLIHSEVPEALRGHGLAGGTEPDPTIPAIRRECRNRLTAWFGCAMLCGHDGTHCVVAAHPVVSG